MPVRTNPAGSVWPFNSPASGSGASAAGGQVALPYQALLFDFDIAGDQVKSAHRWWLDNQVVERIRKAKARSAGLFFEIKVEGRASKPGSTDFNLKLSWRRARNVTAYLKRHLAHGLANITPDGVGESKSTANNHVGYPVDRAVWVEVVPGRAQVGSRPRRVTRDPPRLISDRANQSEKPFQLRLMAFQSTGITLGPGSPLLGVGGGISNSTAVFQICDIEADRSGLYYAELQGKVLSVGPALSAEGLVGKGPWNTFQAPREVSLGDFAGPLRLTSWGLGLVFKGFGGTKIEFGAPKSWFAMKPRFDIKEFQTGNISNVPSFGGSDSLGTMKLIETRQGCD